ncbi:MFS transporter [Kribbella sp. CA-253562]|uniref:MFS transporter n=1 Tax=Kribbella sp. CA-253562 TaxID=3239942 RepID=UPI003D8ABC1B
MPYLFSFLLGLGFDAGTAGTLMTARAVGAVLGAVIGGAWADRVGIHRAVLQVSVLAGISTLALLSIRGPWTGAVLLALYGAVIAAQATALRARLAQLTSSDQRDRAFSMLYLLGNVGVAGGALIAGLTLRKFSTGAFTLLYILDTVSFILLVVALWMSSSTGTRELARPSASPTTGTATYWHVARDPAARWLCLAVALVVAAGFSQLHVGLPALAITAGISASDLGWVFAANLVTLVIVQSPASRLSATWRRSTSVLAGIAVLTVAWGVLGVIRPLNVPLLVVVAVVFAVGEVLLAPVMAALVNDLAPESLRGRYNGAAVLAWTGGWLCGTALTGAALNVDSPHLLVPLFVTLLGMAAVAVICLRGHLPAGTDHPSGSHSRT